MKTTPPLDAVSEIGDPGDPGLRSSVAYVLGQLCLPVEMAADLPGVGRLLLRPALVERRWGDASLQNGLMESIAVTCAGRPGALLVERRTACRLVSAVLRLPLPMFAGPLSRIERGVLEGTVAAILARITPRRAFGLRGGAGEGLLPGRLAIAISVQLEEEMGRAWLVASDASLERLWTTRDASGDEGAPWLEVARTRVPEREMASAEAGDVLVFDETAALSPTTVWTACVLWCGRRLPVQWSENGLVTALEDAAALEAKTRNERCFSAKEPGGVGKGTRWAEVSAGVECDLTRHSGHDSIVVARGDRIHLKVDGHYFGQGDATRRGSAFAVAIAQRASG